MLYPLGLEVSLINQFPLYCNLQIHLLVIHSSGIVVSFVMMTKPMMKKEVDVRGKQGASPHLQNSPCAVDLFAYKLLLFFQMRILVK